MIATKNTSEALSKMKRRTFLSYSVLAAAPLLLPNLNLPLSAAAPASGRKLIMLHLKGGNDGFNTLIPYRNPTYYLARPTLAIAAQDVIKLDDSFGLHPALNPLKKHFTKGHMLVINNISSYEMDHSHFSAAKFWEKESIRIASPWVDNYWPQQLENQNILPKSREYINDDFIAGMEDLALAMNQNPAQTYHISLDGFDTHQFQKYKHDLLLETYAKGIDQLLTALENSGELKHTTIVTWSEFGRQLKENTKKGTDHGYSNMLMIYGGNLKQPLPDQLDLTLNYIQCNQHLKNLL